jgi:protein-S-isoprenylcysteine O-methyltransferase Ste14
VAFTAKAEQPRWTRYAGVLAGIILVIVLLIRLRVFRGPGTATGNPWLPGAGLALFVLGLALAVWARVHLGRNWGMPMSQRAGPELVTSGTSSTRTSPAPYISVARMKSSRSCRPVGRR